MIPLLPFALGLATGLAAVRLLKSDTTRAGLEQAQARLSSATASGLAAVERASAKARQRLTEPATEVEPAAPEAAAAPLRPAAKKARRTSTTAAKPPGRQRSPVKATRLSEAHSDPDSAR